MGAGESSQPQSTSDDTPAPVRLHVYDVLPSAANTVLRTFNTGAFHCGVEVYGREWSYRGSVSPFLQGTGVFACYPRRCEDYRCCESVLMPRTRLTQRQVLQLLRVLAHEWQATSYDLLKHNCCHFCSKFCWCLGVGEIPDRFTNLAGAGAAVADAEGLLARCGPTALLPSCTTEIRVDDPVVEVVIPEGARSVPTQGRVKALGEYTRVQKYDARPTRRTSLGSDDNLASLGCGGSGISTVL